MKIDFQDVGKMDPAYGPPKSFQCVDGIESHTWTLNLEEGQIHLTCGCNLCEDGLQELEPEDFGGEFTDVQVKFYQEDDGYWYWYISPRASDERA